MSIREWINENSTAVGWVTGGVAAVGLTFAVLQLRSGGRPVLPELPDRTFYTTDDGATLFADSLSRIPPIDHGGKKAVRAHVYTCDGGRHQWVQYLEKYSETDQKLLAGKESPTQPPGALVKKPGAADWISRADPKAVAIVEPKCPDGSGEPQPVIP